MKNSEGQLVRTATSSMLDGIGPTHGGGNSIGVAMEGGPTYVQQFMRVVRHHYILALLLALVGIGVGGYVGNTFSPAPQYRTTGLLRIAPTLPKLLYDNEYNSRLPNFKDYLKGQEALMTSPRVVNLALSSDTWREVAEKSDLEGSDEVRRYLKTSSKGEIVQLSFTHVDPEVTAAAVRSVLESYYSIYGERDVKQREDQLRILRARENALKAEVQAKQEDIFKIAKEKGSDSLDSDLEHKKGLVRELENELQTLEVAMIRLGGGDKKANDAKGGMNDGMGAEKDGDGAKGGKQGTNAKAAGDVDKPKATEGSGENEPTVEELAQYDQELYALLRQRRAVEGEIDEKRSTLGPRHREMIRLVGMLTTLNRQIASYLEDHRELILAKMNAKPIVGPSRVVGPAVTVEQLRGRKDELVKLLARRESDQKMLERTVITLKRLKIELAEVEEQWRATKQRIEELTVEANAQDETRGRIEIVNRGDKPSKPYRDTRIQMTVLGGMGGLALGLGSLLLFGIMDKRIKSADEAVVVMDELPLLGILPHLPEDLSDPLQAALSAQAVHHIRTLLQIGVERRGAQVLCVTSPSSGDGKTSLCLALGVAFAQTQMRTLLVDCDLTAGTLSVRTQAMVRRKIGRVLVREGLVTQDQLSEALVLARASGRRLGEVVTEMGLVTREEMERALDLQENLTEGLLDVIDGVELESCVAETGIVNLSSLARGSIEDEHACQFSPKSFRRVMDEAKKHFDVILIDTGPILGSAEASLVASESDATVMVVSRGGNRANVDRARRRMEMVGSEVAGVVFNRAHDSDFSRHASSTSQQSRIDPDADVLMSTVGDGTKRFGPVAWAVSSSDREQGAASGEVS